MKVSVKILQGAECCVEIVGADSVEHLKELVKAQLNISPSDQRLLHKGKTLQEGTLIQEYNLREGDKLHLVVKKDSTPPATVAPSSGCIETQTEPLARSLVEQEMQRLLKPHYNSDSEVRKVVSAFVKIVDKKLVTLSLDDIERICDTWNKENILRF